MNVRSVRNKLNDLHAYLDCYHTDVLLLTETWLTSDLPSSAVIAGSNYKLLRKDRPTDSSGGGVAALISADFDFVSVEVPSEFHCLELLCFDLLGPNIKYRIILWYRAPCSDLANLKLFTAAFDFLSRTDASIILAGDFNLPNIDWSSSMSCGNALHDYFIEFVNKSALFQHVIQSTRLDNTLDLVLSNDPFAILNCNVFEPFSSSDHNIVNFDLYYCSLVNANHDIEFYDYAKADWESFNEFIYDYDWKTVFNSCTDCEELWAAFSGVIHRGINSFVPVSIHKIRNNNIKSYPSSIRKLCAKKRRLWKMYKASNKPEVLESFKRCAKEHRSAIYKYHCQLELNLTKGNNLGKFYRYVNKKLVCHDGIGPISDSNGSLVNDAGDKANIFAEYFSSVFICDNGNTPNMESRCNNSNLSNIYFTTENVIRTIKKLKPNTSAGPDQCPSNLYRNLVESISSPLAALFECLFINSYVPKDWRSASITPLHKKGSRTDPSNYRPISLTCVCCKLMESIIKQQLLYYLNEHKLISKQQFGFLSRHSSCSQLLDCFNEWTIILDARDSIDCVYIDYSKAFDSVVHNKLLAKLSAYGIEGNLFFWIKCFLCDRTQYVVIDGHCSSVHKVLSGVPQGSVLGPILFIIYINDIVDVVENNCFCKLYADDVKLFARIDMSTNILQLSLNNIFEWSVKWQLTINAAKCNYLLIGNVKSYCINYHISNVLLPSVSNARDLGLTVSSNLKFSSYIVDITNKAFARSALILRSFVTRDPFILSLAFTTYVRPLVEYCTPVWYPTSASDIRLVEKVQRNFTKRITAISSLTYHQRLEHLSLDSLELRRLRFDLHMVYRILHNLIDLSVDSYFTQSILSLRCGGCKLFKPRCNTAIRQNYFSIRIINCWNILPEHIISAPSLTSFKRLLLLHDLSNCLSGYVQ